MRGEERWVGHFLYQIFQHALHLRGVVAVDSEVKDDPLNFIGRAEQAHLVVSSARIIYLYIYIYIYDAPLS